MQKVVITGMGAVTPLGLDLKQSWSAALAGTSGVAALTQKVLPGVPALSACEVKGFDPETVQSKKDVRRQDRFQHLALAAAVEAVTDSGLDMQAENPHRVAVLISACSGGYQSFEQELLTVHEKGARSCSPFAITKIMPNGAAALVAMRYGAQGPSTSICTACASSTDAIGYATLLLRTGICDVVIAGGAEASLHSVSMASFDRMGLMTRRRGDTPSPFCRQRDGLVIGEGAAVLVLETEEHARQRGARICAQVAGYGATTDAHHITSPLQDGSGAAAAISTALRDAHLDPEEVDYINAHGTGTRMNDAMETRAIQKVFGTRASTVPVSSTKSMTGHLMGAAGALETAFAALTIRDSVLPPTIHFSERDPECDLDCVPNTARPQRVACALTHSFGFGGHNAVLALKAMN